MLNILLSLRIDTVLKFDDVENLKSTCHAERTSSNHLVCLVLLYFI